MSSLEGMYKSILPHSLNYLHCPVTIPGIELQQKCIAYIPECNDCICIATKGGIYDEI